MNDTDKTQEQLINELAEARERIVELNALETERKLTLSKARRRAAQLALIYDVGQRVSGELELEALFSEIVAAVRDAFDYYGVMLLLLDEDAKHLDLQSVVGDLADVFPEGLKIAVGEGMIGHAAATGKVQISADVSQDSHHVRVAGEKTRSELVVPITSGQKVIGVLDLQSDEFNAFDGDVVMVMETLADQIAVAIENARLFEEAQQRLQEQAMLFNVSRMLASAPLQPEGIAEIVARQFVEVMGVSECSLSLLTDQRDALRVMVSVFTDKERETFYQEHGAEVDCLADYPSTARAIETLQPLMVQASDPDADPAELAYMHEFGVVTEVLIPLVVKGQAIGIIEFEEHDQERHYTEEEIDLAMTLASQAAAAMENARLYETVQQELAERQRAQEALKKAYDDVEKQVEERTAELQQETVERERLQQEVIKAQKEALRELSTPVIPIMDRIIVMPLVGNIDSMRARDITRALLAGIRQQRAKVVILDITGVSVVDSGVAEHLNKTVQAARLKGARTIVTGISDAVAETIVDLGIDWSGIETVRDLQTGLVVALNSLGISLKR